MRRIIWNFQAFQAILSGLQDAFESLEQCREELRTVSLQGEELFRRNTGISRQILEAIDSAALRAGKLSDRTDEAYIAMSRVQSMIASTEDRVRRMAGGALPPSCQTENPLDPVPAVHYVNMGEHITGIVPEWLMDAANRVFLS